MALIKCKECGKEISTTAENCPNCGCRTLHGRSVTEAKGLLVQHAIWLIAIIIGAVLFFSSLMPVTELYDEWESIKHVYKGLSFVKFVASEGESGTLWKLIAGLGLVIVGIINVWSIKKKTNSIKGNGFDLEQSKTDDGDWICKGCGKSHMSYVITCSCGRRKDDK